MSIKPHLYQADYSGAGRTKYGPRPCALCPLHRDNQVHTIKPAMETDDVSARILGEQDSEELPIDGEQP